MTRDPYCIGCETCGVCAAMYRTRWPVYLVACIATAALEEMRVRAAYRRVMSDRGLAKAISASRVYR